MIETLSETGQICRSGSRDNKKMTQYSSTGTVPVLVYTQPTTVQYWSYHTAADGATKTFWISCLFAVEQMGHSIEQHNMSELGAKN